MVGINIGCGKTPTPGYRNFDNSPTLKLRDQPVRRRLLGALGLLDASKREYLAFLNESDIRWADATRRIPLPDAHADVVYCSHMVEHLDREEAVAFLREARRVLRPGGVLRIAVPDLRKQVDDYLATGDADAFIEHLLIVQPRPKTWKQKLHRALIGFRDHRWMYDAASMCSLVTGAGFTDARALPAGQTTIEDPGALDLSERSHESLYVEARRPSS